MSSIKEAKLTWLQSFCVRVLRMGPIPRHVAIIMDGNRRYARAQHLKATDGHRMGFDKLIETLQWCLELGITEVTVYAFSIENFKRSREEVDGLKDLAREKFRSFLEDKEQLKEKGVCIRILGNVTLLPKDLQKIVARIVTETANNNTVFLNVCLAYTAQDEIVHAVQEVLEGVDGGLISSSDITENLLGKCLYTSQSPNPDLLVRTSGEVRLSNFLLWQSSYSVLVFLKVLWPDLTIWNVFVAVLYYQMQCSKAKELEGRSRDLSERALHESDRQQASKENGGREASEKDVASYRKKREARVNTFLQHVQNKRQEMLRNILAE